MKLEEVRKKLLPMSETMLYMLASLQEERHGYGIMLHVKDLTDGRIVLGAGTIYQTLGKLENAGLIEITAEADRKKFYRITENGRRILQEETARIGEIYKNLKLLQGEE